MDERFQGRRIWIIFGALGILFLCLALCGLVTMASVAVRSGPVYGIVPQAPAAPGAEGAVPPQVYYGPWSAGGPLGFVAQAVGLSFKLMFVGLLVLLFIGLIRRLLWGPRHCPPHYWSRPPEGTSWEGKAHPGWGPWARHWHGRPPQNRSEPPGSADHSEDAGPAYGQAG